MGKNFRSASSQYFTIGTMPVTAYPFSIGVFFKYTAASTSSGDMTLVSLSDSAITTDCNRLMAYGTASGSGFGARTAVGATDREAKHSMTVDSTTWWWVLGVWAADNDRRIYVVDTGAIGTASQTTSLTPVMDQGHIGRNFAGGVAGTYATGSMSNLTIWNTPFSTTEVDDYWGSGIIAKVALTDPRLVKRPNIVFHHKMNSSSSLSATVYDTWQGIALTPGGNPANDDDAPVSRIPGMG